jgi:uncharacterized membrane protein (DUF2068 family)
MSTPPNPAASADPDKPKAAPTLYFIVVHHLIKGVLLLLAAVGLSALAGRDLGDLWDQLLRWFHLDPAQRFFARIGDMLDQITPANLRFAQTGAFIYGLMLSVGAIGLGLRARWAVWLAIGESAFFIPIELYELVRQHNLPPSAPHHHPVFPHPELGLLVVLTINILIVIYLSKNRNRIFRHHH